LASDALVAEGSSRREARKGEQKQDEVMGAGEIKGEKPRGGWLGAVLLYCTHMTHENSVASTDAGQILPTSA
jgi:hypothetical protein